MSTEISFGMVDVTAKEDSSPATEDKQSFIDLEQLKQDNLQVDKYGTLEYNQFLLDGSYKLFPDEPQQYNFGLWSASMSGSNGVFTDPPVLTVTFGENHSSLGITFKFAEGTGDYCNNLNIKWYDGANNVLADENFNPDNALFFADRQVENYRKLVITFYSTNRPYRYLKLTEIMYGVLKVFRDDNLISANIYEEANILSSEIRINTLDFKFQSTDGSFSLLNMQGAFRLFQKKQWVKAVVNENSTKRDMGTFYLDEPVAESVDVTTLKCIDAIGLMDQTSFRGGMYIEVPAPVLCDEIMTSAGVEYELDEAFSNVILSGWIPISTHREALQQVAFAIGAIVDCSRSDKVKIYPAPTIAIHTIGYNRKIDDHQIKQKALVTGVEVSAHKYVTSPDTQELFNGVLPVGNHTITFNQPMHSLTVTGATITESNVNYAVLSVASQGTVVLSGKTYIDNTQVFGVYMPDLPAGEKVNILQIKEATLVSANNAGAVAQRIYDYYQNRYEDEGTIILEDEEVGDMAIMDSQSNKQIKGYIESLDIDLISFVGKTRIVGKVVG